MARPIILVSNDDGIHADGIRALETALAPLGRVYVVAPESEQSATSHSMSLSRPLRLRAHGPRRWAVDGTPVDSVYVGLHHKEILPKRPDLIVSGINHGLNLGSDVFYSGTVAAAREGALRGIPAIAVSLARTGALALAGAIARAIARVVLATKPVRGAAPMLLNVNIPGGRVRGIRATRLGARLYDELVEIRLDPRGHKYLWIGGPSRPSSVDAGTDTGSHEAGFATVSPLSMELFEPRQLELTRRIVALVPPFPDAPKARARARTPRRTS